MRARRLRRPAAAVIAAAGIAIALSLAWSRDAPADETPGILAGGSFTRLAWPTSGRAELSRDASGRLTLALSNFSTHPAPDLDVYLVPGRVAGGDVEGGTKVGRLARVSGDWRYAVPAGFERSGTTTVVIWCAACTSPFGAATLSPSDV